MKDDDADVFEVLKKTVIHKEKLGDKKICKMAKPYKVTTKSKLDNMSEHSNTVISDVNNVDEIGDNDEIKIKNEQIIWIDETKLQNAPKQLEIYKTTIDIIVQNWGTGIWVERAKIVKEIDGDIDTNHSHLVAIAKKSKNAKDEMITGLIMKKKNNIVYLRLN
jgi:hypothetical protein